MTLWKAYPVEVNVHGTSFRIRPYKNVAVTFYVGNDMKCTIEVAPEVVLTPEFIYKRDPWETMI